MVDVIPPVIRNVWENWQIRGAVLSSLLLQIILIAIAPFRKRSGNKLLIFFIWSSYLLADAIAIYAIGAISQSITNASVDVKCPDNVVKQRGNAELMVFWSTFLLIHLGGPDTITAFALADSQLWIRQLIALFIHAIASIYLFLLTLPGNKVTIPIILVFISGVIKYLERSVSLYRANNAVTDPLAPYFSRIPAILINDEMRESGGSFYEQYAKSLAEQYANRSTLPDQLRIVRLAYYFFNYNFNITGDTEPVRKSSFRTHAHRWGEFAKYKAEDTLRVMELELNLFYEKMFTKALVVHTKWGYISRFLTLTSAVAVVLIFRFDVVKQQGYNYYNQLDVGISYALLIGAILLDLYSFFAAVFSDWTVGMYWKWKFPQPLPSERIKNRLYVFFVPIFRKLINLKKSQWVDVDQSVGDNHHHYHTSIMSTGILFRRWSGYISGHSLIRYCLKRRPQTKLQCGRRVVERTNQSNANTINDPKWLICHLCDRAAQIPHINTLFGWFGILKNKSSKPFKDLFDEIKYVSREPLTRELWEFIYDELFVKKAFPRDWDVIHERINSARGQWVLEYEDGKSSGQRQDLKDLKKYIEGVSYDESLVLWHTATDLLYFTESNDLPAEEAKAMEFSKILSDYMLYLLIMRPTIISAVEGIGKTRFSHTCKEIKRNLSIRSLNEKEACETLLRLQVHPSPVDNKDDIPVLLSVLSKAQELTQVLRDKVKETKWSILSKVWVEMLSFAAVKSGGPRVHAEPLSKGGELITFVWLFYVHCQLI